MKVFKQGKFEEIDAPELLNILNTCLNDTAAKADLEMEVIPTEPEVIHRKFWTDDPDYPTNLVIRNVKSSGDDASMDFEILPPEDYEKVTHSDGSSLLMSYQSVCDDVLRLLKEIRSYYPPRTFDKNPQ